MNTLVRLQDLRQLNGLTTTELVNQLIILALSYDASDIHCDPLGSGMDIKFRIDGLMEHIGCVKTSCGEFISRLKVLSSTRTDVHSIPQDGHWQHDADGQMVNIRISFMPTFHGENAVMRLLPIRAREGLSLAKLGFSPETASQVYRAMKRNSGMILVSGPTGSGKSTTLHACLSIRSGDPVSIITLEDPIEYELKNTRQIHIKHSLGVTFATGLRSALRQDPDIIMVGEIRDEETARIAVHTAMTGHLVLSTIHTNSAVDVVARLIDMGIDRYLLADTLKLVIAQRLVRTLCELCTDRPYIDAIQSTCTHCRGSGYFGRTIIAEVLEFTDRVRGQILVGSSSDGILETVRQCGFRSLEEDALEKLEWGLTTREEISRTLYGN